MRTTQRGAALLAALCLPLGAGCSGEPEGSSSPTATSPKDAPVLQPGRPGESATDEATLPDHLPGWVGVGGEWKDVIPRTS